MDVSYDRQNFEAAQLGWDNYQALAGAFDHYVSVHPGWGSLHIVLEDGSAERSSVEFCLQWAVDRKDWLGAYLASVLLGLTDAGIEIVVNYRGGIDGAFLEVLMQQQVRLERGK